MEPATVSVDGRLLPASGPHLSAWDRGFQLGDGVFETLRATAGRAVELGDHLERLRHALAAVRIAAPDGLEASIADDIARLLAAESLAGPDGDAAIRITVTRGAWLGRGILPPDDVRPTVVVQAWRVESPPARYLTQGLALAVSSVRRDPENPLAGIKSTSRADAIFARLEARDAGADDALFLTIDGYLSEATSANLFLVRDGELATPERGCGILAGTTRAWLLGWAEGAGLRAVEDLLTTRDLAEADEAFVSSSVAGVLPVTRFEGSAIGNGTPGPWTVRARADREACFAPAGSPRGRAIP